MCSVHLQVVPNGKLVFFPSHEQLNDAVSHWRMTGWLERSVLGLDRFCGMPVPWRTGPALFQEKYLGDFEISLDVDLQISSEQKVICNISKYTVLTYVYVCITWFLKYSRYTSRSPDPGSSMPGVSLDVA